ncbi:hypothetical protein KIW84_022402 [Lathyrus oleraceus]|uniref:Uncharacterized protein n=1 Tax=Pisum sativum TaxID=3888 RepID=A0A9D4YB53_PEA|nr:hypothetical protein KIW84_022402 [Pisum sativum]
MTETSADDKTLEQNMHNVVRRDGPPSCHVIASDGEMKSLLDLLCEFNLPPGLFPQNTICNEFDGIKAAATQAVGPQLPPIPQGIANEFVADTLLHPDLFQPPQITRSTMGPPLRPPIPPLTSRQEA